MLCISPDAVQLLGLRLTKGFLEFVFWFCFFFTGQTMPIVEMAPFTQKLFPPLVFMAVNDRKQIFLQCSKPGAVLTPSWHTARTC